MLEEKQYAYISRVPGVCGGRPIIAGKRIRVQDVAVTYEQGYCPEEICQFFPPLTLGQVHAALAYYFDHRGQIQADLEEDRRFVEEFKRQNPESVR